MGRSSLSNLIFDASRETGLNPKLIAAVIHKESGGTSHCSRYEPNFERNYLRGKNKIQLGGFVPGPSGASWETEYKDRATSFGPMQIMGQTAREHGYKENFLVSLCLPDLNIPLGARILKHKIDQGGTLEYALTKRWNGGGNPNYGKEVIHILESGTADYLLIR